MTDEKLLEGIRVLDLTSVVVGPATTLRLVDLGATVMKVETPEGDVMRSLGGPSHTGRFSGKFLHFNRGKRFIALDLKTPAGLEAMHRLLATCDVFVSNIRPEALARLGLDAEACRARQPRLIHCNITGFGPGGPYRGLPAYDTVIQGASGITGLTLKRDGAPNFVPLLIGDHTVAEITAGHICAALVRRERSGQGATLEIPMLETMAAYNLEEHLGPATFSPPLGNPGDTRVLDPHHRPVATKDGWITLTANTDRQAAAFLRTIGRHDLLDDPRFKTVAGRFRHAKDWYGLRVDALRGQESAYWLKALAEADVPAMPCYALEQVEHDPHLKAVGLLVDEEHPEEGPIRSIRPTALIDGRNYDLGPPAKPIGADTEAVLAEAGLSADEIAAAVEGRRGPEEARA
ncbi:CaiB/BaiF CoA transferase family protein [Muricoccus radiodurans]|uniref:CaiB/BaiF CoA transferase family protein n=1 Tax=Muricoccus radiodurans TaxID=2231721 RepID=UPI003CF01228